MDKDPLGDAGGALENVERKLAGHVGVDTAKLIICDPAYISSQRLEERESELTNQHLEALSHGEGYPQSYGIDYLLGHEGAAVVVRSGIGDGFYPVYVTLADIGQFGRRVVRVEVDFLEHVWLETLPLQMPEAIDKLLKRMRDWLPLVQADGADDFLQLVNAILNSNPEEKA